MKRTFAVLIILIALGSLSFCNEPLSNEGKRGLYVKSLEQVLRLQPEEIDLATAVLVASEQWSDVVAGRRYLSRLDEMAIEIKRRLSEQKIPRNHFAIPVLNDYLFKELGFNSVEKADNPEDLFLHNVLDAKRGYCLSLSVLYLSLGERIGLPLYGVVVPGHFFVRYDDGNIKFNIESTSKGGNASDGHYISKFNSPSGNDTIYMQNLNNVQVLGCFFNNLGNSYMDVGKMDAAQLALERAAHINPLLSEAKTNLGNIYMKQGRISEAMELYRHALSINFDDAKTHNNLGNAYRKLDRIGEAISEYQLAIVFDSNFLEPRKNMINGYLIQEKYPLALTEILKALEVNRDDAGLYSLYGDLCRLTEKYWEAIEKYDRSLKSDPKNSQVYFHKGLCYSKLGLAAEEMKSYEEALRIEPKMTAALVAIGNVRFEQKDYDAAIKYYQQAVESKPDDSMIYYNLGAALSNKGDYQKAVACYKESLALSPDMAMAHSAIGLAYYNLENYELARAHISKAKSAGADVPKGLVEALDKIKN